ncbi:MAG: CotH kinase family protein [Planctomycetota bacterium]|jgi:hypothetical protein
MKGLFSIQIVAIATVVLLLSGGLAQGEITNHKDPNWPAPVWPEIFEPNQTLMNLNIEMLDPNDWDIIRLNGMLWDDVNEEYYENTDPNVYLYELPAWFWADGEIDMKIKVAVRHKSCFPLGDVNDRYFKISLKVDINQYYTEDANGDPNGDPNAVAHWHGLSKLSLENGDDSDVVAEGLACNLHTMSSGAEGYGYDSWRSNWTTLTVEDVNRGVYINTEQRNKRFLINRNLYDDPCNIWMYKVTGENETLMKVPDKDSGEVPPEYPDSPGFVALDYIPFDLPNSPPDDANLVIDMNTYVDMQGLLTMGAVNALIANVDSLFSHYQNTYFLDFNLDDPNESRKRMYLPWDMDATMTSIDWDIYDRTDSVTWQDVFLDSPTYRPQFNQIMTDLMDVSLTRSNIHSFLNMMEPILHDALLADPYNQFDVVDPGLDQITEHFNKIKMWYSDRIVNVLDQLWWDEPPGTVLLKDNFEGATWDANWPGSAWVSDTDRYKSSYTSAYSEDGSEGDFTCGNLDVNDANVVHVAFWFRKDTGGNDILLYYYNGTTDTYDFIEDLGDDEADKEWLQYRDVITDSNYFEPDFKIRFNTSVKGKQDVRIDDVQVTKLLSVPNQPVISGYVLDPKNKELNGITMSADNGGGSVSTDVNGFYSLPVPYGWSGTVTPTDAEYTFDPAGRTYSHVVIDHPERWVPDYRGTSIYDFNADGYVDFLDYSVFVLAWGSSIGETNWDASCDFVVDNTIDFKDLDKFVGAWLLP